MNGTLNYILTTEGCIKTQGSDWDAEYSIKDHPGNTRAVFLDSIISSDPRVLKG